MAFRQIADFTTAGICIRTDERSCGGSRTEPVTSKQRTVRTAIVIKDQEEICSQRTLSISKSECRERRAWMDHIVFDQWLHEPRIVDKHLDGFRRVLFMDNCSGHNETPAVVQSLQRFLNVVCTSAGRWNRSLYKIPEQFGVRFVSYEISIGHHPSPAAIDRTRLLIRTLHVTLPGMVPIGFFPFLAHMLRTM